MYEGIVAIVGPMAGVVRAGRQQRSRAEPRPGADLLDAAGVPAPRTMQGRSLVPLLRGRTPRDWRDAIYYQYFEYPGWHMVRRHYGVRTKQHKLIHYYELGEWELFDLRRDPRELRSVYADPAYASVVRNMKRRLTALRAHYREPARDPVPYRPFTPRNGA
jgi:arylsulfatase A-like enzyme